MLLKCTVESFSWEALNNVTGSTTVLGCKIDEVLAAQSIPVDLAKLLPVSGETSSSRDRTGHPVWLHQRLVPLPSALVIQVWSLGIRQYSEIPAVLCLDQEISMDVWLGFYILNILNIYYIFGISWVLPLYSQKVYTEIVINSVKSFFF